MNIFQITKVEFTKILKKRISLVMLIIFVLPVFYVYCMVTDAEFIRMYPAGAFDFSVFGMWGLLGMTGVFQILFSLVTVGALASEIDRGQMKMAVLRQCSRRKIIYGKAIALSLYMVLCCVMLIIFSLIAYYLFIVGTKYGTGEFIVEDWMNPEGISMLLVGALFPLMDTIISAGLLFLFSLRYKAGICFMLAIGLPFVFQIAMYFPWVQYLVPMHVSSLHDFGDISTLGAGLICLIYIAFAALCVKITANKFERMDLK